MLAVLARGGDASLFLDLVGRDVKVSYHDRGKVKTAHARLLAAEEGHITIETMAGILAIDEKDVISMEASSISRKQARSS